MKININIERYEIIINGKKVKKINGRKNAEKIARASTGDMFGKRKVEIINIDTGEITNINVP